MFTILLCLQNAALSEMSSLICVLVYRVSERNASFGTADFTFLGLLGPLGAIPVPEKGRELTE